jgi:hypothetical protein
MDVKEICNARLAREQVQLLSIPPIGSVEMEKSTGDFAD